MWTPVTDHQMTGSEIRQHIVLDSCHISCFIAPEYGALLRKYACMHTHAHHRYHRHLITVPQLVNSQFVVGSLLVNVLIESVCVNCTYIQLV